MEHELCVVVEHLLEVRYQPVSVGAVTRESAAQVVVDAAVGHVPQRLQRHRQSLRVPFVAVAAQAATNRDPNAETWVRCPNPPTQAESKEASMCSWSLARARRRVALRSSLRTASWPRVAESCSAAADRRSGCVSTSVQVRENLRESGSAEALLGREIGAAEEGLQIGREKDGHRPATLARHGLDRGHVDLHPAQGVLRDRL